MPIPSESVSFQSVPITAGDVMPLFLADKQNAATRRAYTIDLRDFFGPELKPERIAVFLATCPSSVKFHCCMYPLVRLAATEFMVALAGMVGVPGKGFANVSDGTLPGSAAMLLELAPPTTRSGFPSPFISATATG